MGSASEMERANRFMAAFNAPLLGKLGIGVGTTLEIVSESLATYPEVRHVVLARVTAVGQHSTNVIGDEVTLIVDGICVDLFDPEWDGPMEVEERLEDVIPAAEVARLWAEADL